VILSRIRSSLSPSVDTVLRTWGASTTKIEAKLTVNLDQDLGKKRSDWLNAGDKRSTVHPSPECAIYLSSIFGTQNDRHTPISANSSASLCLPHNSRVDSLPSRRRRMWHGSSHRPPSETLLKPASELSYCKYFPTSSFKGIDDQYINYGYVCPPCQRPSVLNFFDDRFQQAVLCQRLRALSGSVELAPRVRCDDVGGALPYDRCTL
jgi:hypothetical protein